MLFEIYWQIGGSRELFASTSDRLFAHEVAQVATKVGASYAGEGHVAMLLVVDGGIENDEPDWQHPDFRRPKLPLPLK